MAKSKKSQRSTEESLTQSAEETRAFGRKLAGRLRPGDCLLLTGELGAGKTTLVQGLAEGLGLDPKEIISPTFVLIREHDGKIPLFHMDAYRIGNARELLEVGLAEYFQRSGITVIEWGEKVRGSVPSDAIEILLEIVKGDLRRIRLIRPKKS
ncbi:MAG: tRNA (adenosine(37)-N6)-threonylcarbamoyltransferase complex ATPase subunit type 1 TsaE [Candidatus Fraserbacteria bacterium RBG_16_55_9]|uniref:tRNA threonylcarbamoyladenosine biosynthesis protein TsaE n=1 Tax=Fraserbacteria sp. (strain RBG_16_55_9) TaxID=1817864 RepID=A0A1F5UNP5_FRAXR|nr:MAG: tRNA (adenosine(37)-N6)-threonylcarbamoyltransferase complex ATPase subunit type 1 TsaE [Candidatus Fraserbacteria bacterium RBG_16_55_9]